jgi:hypothetical protein
MLRSRVLIAACGLASALALIPQANADQAPITGYVTRQSEHFLIHFSNDYRTTPFFQEAKAGDVLGWAERAYARYQAMGYAAPLDDGDGLIDIWIDDLGALGEPFTKYEGYVTAVSPTQRQTAGTIHLDVKRGTNAHAVAHELFIPFAWRIFAQSDSWFEEASAEWAAYQVANTGSPTEDSLGEPDRSLDCIGFECGYSRAEDAPLYDEFYDQNANPGWSFFEYLSETYGRDIVRDVWNRVAAAGPGVAATTPIDQVLATKGTSLSTAFGNWITHRLNGDFTLTAIRAILPQTWGSLATGNVTGVLPQQIVAVNKLAARYLALLPGDGATSGVCYAATLSLQVTIPSGVTSTPYLFVNTVGAIPQALTISGSTASIKLPWNTCTDGARAYLSLPNASTSANTYGKEFTIGGTLTVDPNTIASPMPAPAPVNITGPVGVVPTGAVAPAIEVSGPELIRLSAKATALRLIVTADTDGSLQATLGSYTLGTVTLRAGGNDVQFQLPASLRLRLRTQAATSNVLTLTSLSASGATGQVVKRRVAIEGVKAKSKRRTKQTHR